MKALSIRQPWAWAIIHAGKDIENRSWPTKMRGRFLVHASQGMTSEEYEDFRELYEGMIIPGDRSLPPHRRPKRPDATPSFEDLQRGGVIGSVELVDCVEGTIFNGNPWFFGPWGFVLTNPKPLPFAPLKGKLGFFEAEMPDTNLKDKANDQG